MRTIIFGKREYSAEKPKGSQDTLTIKPTLVEAHSIIRLLQTSFSTNFVP